MGEYTQTPSSAILAHYKKIVECLEKNMTLKQVLESYPKDAHILALLAPYLKKYGDESIRLFIDAYATPVQGEYLIPIKIVGGDNKAPDTLHAFFRAVCRRIDELERYEALQEQ